jgi:hypothetical protein
MEWADKEGEHRRRRRRRRRRWWWWSTIFELIACLESRDSPAAHMNRRSSLVYTLSLFPSDIESFVMFFRTAKFIIIT